MQQSDAPKCARRDGKTLENLSSLWRAAALNCSMKLSWSAFAPRVFRIVPHKKIDESETFPNDVL